MAGVPSTLPVAGAGCTRVAPDAPGPAGILGDRLPA